MERVSAPLGDVCNFLFGNLLGAAFLFSNKIEKEKKNPPKTLMAQRTSMIVTISFHVSFLQGKIVQTREREAG
jgi:hypothetical protein